MTKHIGIVGCSAEGAALCYQTISKEGAEYLGRHNHPEISIHNFPLSEYMKYINESDWVNVARLMLSSEEKLTKTGADFFICPDNTIHQAIPFIKKHSNLPWLHIAEEVVQIIKRNNYLKTGILGTRYLMEGPVYPEFLEKESISYEIPLTEQRQKINQIIFNELVYGTITNESKRYFLYVIEDFMSKGCDSVILGCTEIPLIVLPDESPLPVLDSTRILARAALKYAIMG
jgi:aspartate racemase